MRYRTVLSAVLSSIVLLALIPASGALAALAEKDKVALEVMNDAVKQTVKKTGTEAAGVGSWISQQKYKGR